MSITLYYAEIAVLRPFATCDVCHAQFPSNPLPKFPEAMGLIEIAEKRMTTHSSQTYRLADHHPGELQLRMELNQAGWTQEAFHGKPMLVCSECNGK